MANILLAWELGGGLGHVVRLLKIARGLATLGHRPVLALRNVVEPATLLVATDMAVLQAPFWHPRPRQSNVVLAYADLLAAHGFANAADLHPMVQAWQRLIDLVKPALMVADHSPTACLAACGQLPVVQVGSGFAMPPIDAPTFPRLLDAADSQSSQSQLFDTVCDVQRQRGKQIPQTLTEFLATAGRFITTWPQLDPYRKVRHEDCFGLLGAMPTASPYPDSPRFFGYLAADSGPASEVFEGMAKAGLPGEVFLRGASAAVRARLRNAGVTVHNTPPPIAEVLARVSGVVHHGSLGTAEAALAAARAQVMLPRHLEQRLTAEAVESIGVGKMFMGDVRIDQIVDFIRTAHRQEHAAKAFALAQAIQELHRSDAVAQVIQCCVALL